jgi:hypothetical protein
VTDEEIKAAMKMSLPELEENYPKACMVISYIIKHYPDDKVKISNHKMLPTMIFSQYSNTQIEEMIDKLAIFNGWVKYTAKS